MKTQDPFENLTEYEAEALAKAEKRFIASPEEEHEFSHLPLINREMIFSTYFSSYDNSALDEQVSEEYRKIPLLIHSEKNRMKILCDIAMLTWIPEFDHVLNSLEANEKALYKNEEPDEETVWQLSSFGLEVALDS